MVEDEISRPHRQLECWQDTRAQARETARRELERDPQPRIAPRRTREPVRCTGARFIYIPGRALPLPPELHHQIHINRALSRMQS